VKNAEPNLIQPTFITDYPIEMSPLAKKHRSMPGLVERFEAICNSKEIANAFSELNDPVDQRKRFEEQLELGKRGGRRSHGPLTKIFFVPWNSECLQRPGWASVSDRLSMIMTNSPSIQDVLFFPQMKPENPVAQLTEKDFETIGVRKELVPILQKLGITSIVQLKEMKASKLFNDVCGLRKKMETGGAESYDGGGWKVVEVTGSKDGCGQFLSVECSLEYWV
jgi:lysyl-tRNA synthetase class 2